MRTIAIASLYGLCLPLAAAGQSDNFEWRLIDSEQIALWHNGRQLGNLVLSDGLYYPRIGPGQAGESCRPPYPPPDWAIPKPTGVVIDRVPQEPHHYHKGREIDRDEAFRLLGVSPLIQGPDDKRIPDDSKKLRVTIVGSAERCAGPLAVARQHPEFVAVDYRPDKWMIARQGFAVEDDPTISIQEPGPEARERRHLVGYRGDRAFEAVLIEEAGRKIAPSPNYDPKKVPGWDDSPPASPSKVFLFPWIPAGVLSALTIFALSRRRPKL